MFALNGRSPTLTSLPRVKQVGLYGYETPQKEVSSCFWDSLLLFLGACKRNVQNNRKRIQEAYHLMYLKLGHVICVFFISISTQLYSLSITTHLHCCICINK